MKDFRIRTKIEYWKNSKNFFFWCEWLFFAHNA